MPSETVPQAHDERADQLVGSVDRIKLRQLATPQPFHQLNRRHPYGRCRNIAEESRAHLVERHGAAIVFKEDADLFVGRSRRDCPFSHGV